MIANNHILSHVVVLASAIDRPELKTVKCVALPASRYRLCILKVTVWRMNLQQNSLPEKKNEETGKGLD